MKQNHKGAALIAIFLAALSISAGRVLGTAVGITPDKLVFDSQEESFTIINPDKESIRFKVKTEGLECRPEEGKTEAEGRTRITCRMTEESLQQSIILVETKPEGEGKRVGVMPAVALKAEVPGGREKETRGEEDTEKDGAEDRTEDRTEEENETGPEEEKALKVTGGSKKTERTNTGKKSGNDLTQGKPLSEMKTELTTIAMLTAAIIFLLAYTEIRDRKNGKRKSKKRKDSKKKENTKCAESDQELTNVNAASSTQDAPADQPSASGEASPDPPSPPPAHTSTAQNQPHLYHWR